jgi:ribosome-associated protein
MPQSEPQKPNNESKSQRKEDMLALQKIGESLIKLTEEKLATIDLPNNLLIAIQHIKSFTSNEAKRRQLQYIGKIMRQIDPGSIKPVNGYESLSPVISPQKVQLYGQLK